jgi:hypothetical protein
MTKEIMQQYEYIRQSGVTNMFDYNKVIHYADIMDFEELANVTYEEYKNILMNFSKYMKEFNIKQGGK